MTLQFTPPHVFTRKKNRLVGLFVDYIARKYLLTVPTAEILSGKNARAWVSMVLYLEKLK